MNKNATQAVTAAINAIANMEDYQKLKHDVAKLATIDSAGFIGKLDVLNVLVELTREHGPSEIRRLWDIADRVHVEAFPETHRATYQAGYMAQRRRRLIEATKLYERETGKQLQLPERETFRKNLQATWMFWRDEIVHGLPPGVERNALVREFWDDIDTKLKLAAEGDRAATRYVLGDKPDD